MLRIYLTVDTEYSAGWYLRHRSADFREDFARSIEGRTSGGAAGISYQMDVLDDHGLKGVYFVDPMPALVWGTGAIAAIVEPIVARGHDVQLHLHPEWLELSGHDAITRRRSASLADFALDEQAALLDLARTLLMQAGAPSPVAFRAGNYAANDDTLRALAAIGMAYDTSFCPGIDSSACRIDLPRHCHEPVHHCGVIEVPIGSIAGHSGRQRHGQITALSAWEMRAALGHARRGGSEQFTIVSHSFELLSRDRRHIHPIVRRRFVGLCKAIAESSYMTTATYSDTPPRIADSATKLLPHSWIRTGYRLAEQSAGNLLFGGRR